MNRAAIILLALLAGCNDADREIDPYCNDARYDVMRSLGEPLDTEGPTCVGGSLCIEALRYADMEVTLQWGDRVNGCDVSLTVRVTLHSEREVLHF